MNSAKDTLQEQIHTTRIWNCELRIVIVKHCAVKRQKEEWITTPKWITSREKRSKQ